MHRRWLVNRTNKEYIRYLSKTASVSPVLAQILINRGIKTSEEINNFLNPAISKLSDPFDIPGINVAVERILDASKRGERVLVHGDYDVDGLSATAIIFKALKMLGIDCSYFIPHRMEHGYGFNLSSLEEAKQIGVKLIITVDCGITSFETVSLSKKEGIDVIISDHHEPVVKNEDVKIRRYEDENLITSQFPNFSTSRFLLPDAFTIVNPKISNLQSPVSHLSGAGVAFKIVQALAMSASGGSNSPFSINDFLDLAALGTIADVVPITDENRVIVKEGLKLLENGIGPGLMALKSVSGIEKRGLKTGLLLFTIIPRINAAGRISDSRRVVQLLITDSEDEAIEIASWLDKLNSERQEIEEVIYQEAMGKLNKKGISPAIVLSSEGWHRGVIGIVASRIAEFFCRPTFIVSTEGEIARGSARSIPHFDIYKGLTHCREFLTDFGGHKQAAGFKLKSEDILSFEEKMNRIVNESLADKDFVPALEIDASVNLSDITFNLLREFDMLEPFGFGNPEPRLGSKGLEVFNPRVVGNNHLKMKLKQRSHSLDVIGFDMAEFIDRLEVLTTIDAVFTPFINEWEGGRCLQLNLKAFRPSL